MCSHFKAYRSLRSVDAFCIYHPTGTRTRDLKLQSPTICTLCHEQAAVSDDGHQRCKCPSRTVVDETVVPVAKAHGRYVMLWDMNLAQTAGSHAN